MPVLRKLRLAYFVHSLRSDWNNGNAHFLRGLMRALGAMGHEVVVFEPHRGWSAENLMSELCGEDSLWQFAEVYPELKISEYEPSTITDETSWRKALAGFDIVVVHEWNPPELAHALLKMRLKIGYRMLFHDTHHRASSSPKQIQMFGVDQFDGVVAFGEVLRNIYREQFGMMRVWTLHEAADTTVFRPFKKSAELQFGAPLEELSRESQEQRQDVVWIGNWGDNERSEEIREFLLRPASVMRDRRFTIYGVRYPEEAQKELRAAKVRYGGYLANLNAPSVYAESRLTVHVPRRQYAGGMVGIPTIRVFEALACGIPLVSAPWNDVEGLFRKGDMVFATNCEEMRSAMVRLLEQPQGAEAQATRGLETVLARHTCAHRAEELTAICQEMLG
jgi:spore maturation protein CgeB